MRGLLGALALVLLLAVCGCTHRMDADVPGRGSLSGYLYRQADGLIVSPAVRDDLIPLAGITIGAPQGQQAVTDAAGFFRLDDLGVGPQELAVTGPGITQGSFAVTVVAGANAVSATLASRTARYQWTVLVYMAGDNSLSEQGAQDLNEMEQVGSSDEVMVAVQYDRLGRGDTRRYAVARDTDPERITSPVVEALGEADMGNPATLHDFVQWGQRQYPAEHYLLVLWDHGLGWDPQHRMGNGRSICEDLTDGSEIAITDLAGSLQGTDPMDIIAMDACLMAMFEVVYQVRDCARYLVASEELVPDIGYDYAALLGALTSPAGLAMSPREFATTMAGLAQATWASRGNSTCSVVELARLEAVATDLHALCRRLVKVGPYHKDALRLAQREAIRFGAGGADVRADLGHYVELLRMNVDDREVQGAADRLMRDMQQAVVANASDRSNTSGISIYLPTRADFIRPRDYLGGRSADDQYRALDLARQTWWDEWLRHQP